MASALQGPPFVVRNPEAWNEALQALDGHLLQSWQWGEFKNDYGWLPERIAVGGAEPRAMAQVLYRHKGPVSIGYIPRGPAVRPGDLEATRLLIDAIDANARKHRALYVMIETDLPDRGPHREPITGLRAGSPASSAGSNSQSAVGR